MADRVVGSTAAAAVVDDATGESAVVVVVVCTPASFPPPVDRTDPLIPFLLSVRPKSECFNQHVFLTNVKNLQPALLLHILQHSSTEDARELPS